MPTINKKMLNINYISEFNKTVCELKLNRENYFILFYHAPHRLNNC